MIKLHISHANLNKFELRFFLNIFLLSSFFINLFIIIIFFLFVLFKLDELIELNQLRSPTFKYVFVFLGTSMSL